MESMDRRTFFGRLATLGVGAVAWACRSKVPSGPSKLSLIPTGQTIAVGDTRMAFALFVGERSYAPTDVRATLTNLLTRRRVPVALHRELAWRGSGDLSGGRMVGTEVMNIYVFHYPFTATIWEVTATTGGRSASGAFQVAASVPEPVVGDRAIASASPTVSDHRGVDPICTRTPPCSMHQVTIADALSERKPLVIVFATPRYCQSRTCGPVVDVVEEVSRSFAGRANFVHVEVYRNEQVALTPDGDSPTYREWKLSTEPWTYFVGADGIIKDRWLGPVGSRELRSAVSRLTHSS